MNTNIDYNNASMMDLIDYHENEGMDLNMVSGEVLDMLYITQRTIWVTEIYLTKDNEISNNYICPYVVVKVDNKYYLRNLTNEDTYAPYEVIFKEYEYENAMGFLVLPVNVHASVSYEYINRYRYEEYKALVVQKEEKKTTSKFEFTLKQAKEALAEKFGYSIENICIKL
nr:MAG TPA: hypothetical protein [Ackermannviridae sp.]